MAKFTHILTQDPKNVSALIGMSRCYLEQKDLQKAQAYNNLIPEEFCDQSDVKILKKAIDMAQASQEIGDLESLRYDLAQNPQNFDQRITLAKGLFGQGHVEDAIEELFKILTQKDSILAKKAKDELMNFFDILGFSNPLTLTTRKRLSRILFT